MGNSNTSEETKYGFEKKENITTTATISMQLSQDWTAENSVVHHYEQNNIWTVTNILSPNECKELIEKSESLGFADAPLTVGPNQYVMATDVRNNTRVIWDDKNFAAQLWQRLKPFVPVNCTDLVSCQNAGKGFTVHEVGCNERFRFYRYEEMERFNPHFDGCFARDVGNTQEKSFITCIVYLNDVQNGGQTNFFGRESPKVSVQPVTGNCLFFVHKGNLHEGAMIPKGSTERKYVIRTDIMYVANIDD
jgi:hypothetical protein